MSQKLILFDNKSLYNICFFFSVPINVFSSWYYDSTNCERVRKTCCCHSNSGFDPFGLVCSITHPLIIFTAISAPIVQLYCYWISRNSCFQASITVYRRTAVVKQNCFVISLGHLFILYMETVTVFYFVETFDCAVYCTIRW